MATMTVRGIVSALHRARSRLLRGRKPVALATVVVCTLAGVAGDRIWEEKSGSARQWYSDWTNERRGPWNDGQAAVPVASDDPSWGDREALVTLVVFGDAQDGNTKRAVETLRKVESKYSPSDVRIVWKNEPLPFNAGAKPAAEAATGVLALAGRSAFWRFLDLALDNPHDLVPESFEAWASAAGVKERDMGRFKGGLASHSWAAKVDRDLKEGKDIDVMGTPTLFVNGARITGAQSFARIARRIDDELASAKSLVEKGTPRTAVYIAASLRNERLWPHVKGAVEPPGPSPEAEAVANVPVDGAPVLGDARAPVTVVEFGDFECPLTRKEQQTLALVRRAYGAKVRIVWRDDPLATHAHATGAAKLAREARAELGDDGFWTAANYLFASAPALDDGDLLAVAARIHLDKTKVTSALTSKTMEKAIDDDRHIANSLHVDGTPTFFINGRRVSGLRSYEELKRVIDEELPKAYGKGGAAQPSSASATTVPAANAAPLSGG